MSGGEPSCWKAVVAGVVAGAGSLSTALADDRMSAAEGG